MTDSPKIFGQLADIYWNNGLSVIPLRPLQKRPAIEAWTRYCHVLPSPEERISWVNNFPHGNIGLAAGPASNIILLDVDTNSEKIQSIISSLIPSSPWNRIGAKGYVTAYRYNPALDHSFQIKDSNNKLIVELLSTGRQAVLPPSIHPETKLPYVANDHLFSIHKHLPHLPSNLEALLRETLQQEGIELSHSGLSRITEYVPAGARDSTMISLAGLCAMDITRGRLTLQEAFDRMSAWYENLQERVEGDAIDLPKGQQKILEFLQRDVTGERKRPLPLGWDRNLAPETKVLTAAIFNDDHKEWSFQEIKDYLYNQFSEFTDPRAPERYTCIEYILERLSRSPSINTLEKEILLKYMSDIAHIPGLTTANLRKRLSEISRGDLDGTDHTEIAKATIDHIEQFGLLRFQDNHFWQWKGAHWEILDDSEVMRTIAEEFGDFAAAKRQADHRGILQVMQTLVPRSIRTSPIKGINFANYFLTIDNKTLPHIPELGCTFTLPYRHTPNAPAPDRFFKLLHDCWGNDKDYSQKMDALQEALAATLFGLGPILQRCFLLYGVANSGKTTIINIIKALFPSNAISVVPPDQWQDRFAPTMMHEKILNVCGELPEKRMIDGKSLKEIIEGAEIVGQHKGKSLFKFSPRATHWFASNHLPKTMDTSEGFNRRFLIFPFNKPVATQQKVLGLHNLIIEEEREAIVAWAVRAGPRLLARNEYTIPPSHIDMINEMASENNSVRFFLLECPKAITLKKLEAMAERGRDTQQAALDLNGIRTGNNTPAGSNTPSSYVNGYSHSNHSATPPPLSEGVNRNILAMLTKSGSNPTSEESVFLEYMTFCSEAGGVRSVGLRQFRKRLKELSHEMGFTIQIETNALGVETHSYTGLIVVPTGAGSHAGSHRRNSLNSITPTSGGHNEG